MRRIFLMLIALTLVSASLIGCGSNEASAPQKTEDDIRAEIKAEMEAEQKLKEELEAKIRAELEAENQTSADKTANLKSYDDVYQESGLLGAIKYFDANYNQFTEAARKAFADKVSEEVVHRAEIAEVISYMEPEPGPAPHTIEYVEWLYPGIYNSADNTLDINGITCIATKGAIHFIDNNDDVFTIVKAYWISDGNIEDAGFGVAMHPDIYRKVQRSLDITFDKQEFGEYVSKSGEPMPALEKVFKPTEVLKASASNWASDETYPNVYVEAPDKIELLRDAYKTDAYIPVNVIFEQQSSNNASSEEPIVLSALMTRDEIIKKLGNDYTFKTDADGGYFDYYSVLEYDGIRFGFAHNTKNMPSDKRPDSISITSNKYTLNYDFKIGDSALKAIAYCENNFTNAYDHHNDENIFDRFNYTEVKSSGERVNTSHILALEYDTGEHYRNKSQMNENVKISGVRIFIPFD